VPDGTELESKKKEPSCLDPRQASDAGAVGEVEAFFVRQERRWRRTVALLLAAPVVLVTGLVLMDHHGGAVLRWVRGEENLNGRWVYDAPYPDAAPASPAVLRRLHTESLPNWVIAYSASPAAADKKMDAIIAGVKDLNLRRILQNLKRLTQGDLVDGAERIFYQVWAWNKYLDGLGSRWRLDASVRAHPWPVFFLKSYRVTHDLRLRIGATTHRTRLLLRADGTNIVENYLGCTDPGGKGSFVILDSTHSFVSDYVWPMLAEDTSALSGLQRRFAPSVLREARRVLSGGHLALLRRWAPTRSTLVTAVRAINRRHFCGSNLGLSFVPFNGFSRAWQRRFYHLAAAGGAGFCPAVTSDEAVDLSRASERLRTQKGLTPAVGAMSAWFARSVAAHEARHVADEQDPDLREQGPACPGCPDTLGPLGRAELSAFLTAFALPGAGYLHLYQACITASRAPHLPHGKAVGLASRRLGDACTTGPPDQLYRRAATLRRELFGVDERVSIPADFPRKAPLPLWSELM